MEAFIQKTVELGDSPEHGVFFLIGKPAGNRSGHPVVKERVGAVGSFPGVGKKHMYFSAVLFTAPFFHISFFAKFINRQCNGWQADLQVFRNFADGFSFRVTSRISNCFQKMDFSNCKVQALYICQLLLFNHFDGAVCAHE